MEQPGVLVGLITDCRFDLSPSGFPVRNPKAGGSGKGATAEFKSYAGNPPPAISLITKSKKEQ
ncbi:MAG: hypothetical protein DRO99_03470 [Candidatus Aenigmatarchaeota archaeon]|nr:MAG: hypothetical protein DRO99_03470 [Candidatus Aenigmarchaeota archaeon]